MIQVGRLWDGVAMRCIFSIYLILPASLWPWSRISLYPGGKGRPARKADSLTAICEPMWEPRRLTTVWAYTACYRDSFFCMYVFFRLMRNGPFVLLEFITLSEFEFIDYFARSPS
jgi:hypothetical protein